uniref:Uncharacterized protein n=1 Tax=Eutreptiella gymnastica TaxID=73025 RepID=A0A7S4CEH7_9EUGL
MKLPVGSERDGVAVGGVAVLPVGVSDGGLATGVKLRERVPVPVRLPLGLPEAVRLRVQDNVREMDVESERDIIAVNVWEKLCEVVRDDAVSESVWRRLDVPERELLRVVVRV